MRGRVLLEELLAVDAVGPADHRERALPQVRHEHRRDGTVVLEQVSFRDALDREEGLVEVRKLQLARPLLDDVGDRHLASHLLRGLVLA